MERLRSDEGLVEILGYTPPASETARQWLDRFHDEAAMTERACAGIVSSERERGSRGIEGGKPACDMGLHPSY